MNTILKFILIAVLATFRKVLIVVETAQTILDSVRDMAKKMDAIMQSLEDREKQVEKIQELKKLLEEEEKKRKTFAEEKEEEINRLKVELESERRNTKTCEKNLTVAETRRKAAEIESGKTVDRMKEEIKSQRADFKAERKEFETLRKEEEGKIQNRTNELNQQESFLIALKSEIMDLVNCLKEPSCRQETVEAFGSLGLITNAMNTATASGININTTPHNNLLNDINAHKSEKEHNTHAVDTQRAISTPPPITQTEVSGAERISNETKNTQHRKRKVQEVVQSSQIEKSYSRAPALINPLEGLMALSNLEILAHEATIEYAKEGKEENKKSKKTTTTTTTKRKLPQRRGRGTRRPSNLN